jgi:hypothetical protein
MLTPGSPNFGPVHMVLFLFAIASNSAMTNPRASRYSQSSRRAVIFSPGGGLFENFADLPGNDGGLAVISTSSENERHRCLPNPTHRAILFEGDHGHVLEPPRAIYVTWLSYGVIYDTDA